MTPGSAPLSTPRFFSAVPRIIVFAALAFWCLLIFLPLTAVLTESLSSAGAEYINKTRLASLYPKTLGLAFIIAAAAVILGYIPGKLFACAKNKAAVFMLLLLSLVLPRYMLYYAWSLLLDPATPLGRSIASNMTLARFAAGFTSTSVLVMWYWPLAALLICQGWRNIDADVWNSARLDATAWQRFRYVTLPLLGKPIMLAFAVCYVFSLSEFTTFHLAGVDTVGTELAVLYTLSGLESVVVRAAWPIALIAIAGAVLLAVSVGRWNVYDATATGIHKTCGSKRFPWVVLFLLSFLSLVGPVLMLALHVRDIKPFEEFLRLHVDELGYSLMIAAIAAVFAHIIAYGALSINQSGRFGFWISTTVNASIFLAMLLPASVMAVSIIKMLGAVEFTAGLRQNWLIVSAGQACRFAGIALVILILSRGSHQKHLSEMAAVDGASDFKTWLHVHLPCTWPLIAGSFLLVVMLSVTELSATMVLLPAGLPNFAQRLLNQMHYARDQQVIASCLILISVFILMTLIIVLLFTAIKFRRFSCVMLIVLVLFLCGCGFEIPGAQTQEVENIIGRTGHGDGEFLYPRAIDISDDGIVAVVDKTGRIQKFTPGGEFISKIQMPLTEDGKPVGLTHGPDGNLYVADTHYQRVLVLSPEGEIVMQFGEYGKEEGQFIYPTDVEFADEKIYVSEYGGNDRISVFDLEGEFLFSFGTWGSGDGQFSRPSALCVNHEKKLLYVADACNHRIAVYDFYGKLVKYFGTSGLDAGQLRYPYDIELLEDGKLAVCEYGNNRLQIFDDEGNSLSLAGTAGREPGQLAYPWGVADGEDGSLYIVDGGNNRVQVWKL